MKENRKFLKDIPYIVAVALVVISAAIFGFLYNGNRVAVDSKGKDAVSSGAEVKEADLAPKAEAHVNDIAVKDGAAELSGSEIVVAAEEQPSQAVKQNKEKNNSSIPSGEKEEFISRAEAKKKALAHAGLKEADIRAYEIELDRERNIVVYEIDFKSGRFEYSYEINAKNGKVVKSEKEYDD